MPYANDTSGLQTLFTVETPLNSMAKISVLILWYYFKEENLFFHYSFVAYLIFPNSEFYRGRKI